MNPLQKALVTLKRYHDDWVPGSDKNVSWGNGWTGVRLYKGLFYVFGFQLRLVLTPTEFRTWIHKH